MNWPAKNAVSLAFCLTLIAVVFSTPMSSATEKPNVLFIAVDDLNDWIGVLGGHPDTITPNIDCLAARGVLFDNAHCAAPACNPSRAALMTGRRPHKSGVYINPQPWRPMMPDVVTLPQHFMAHGYHVRGGGKIFHGRYEDPKSWHEWFDSGSHPPLPAKEKKNPHSRAGGIVWGNLHDTPNDQMVDCRLATWCVEFLGTKHDRPFFLGCGFKKPHMPWQVPGEYYDRFPVDKIAIPEVPDGDLDDIPEAGIRMAKPDGDHLNVTSTDNWAYAVQGYLATINFLDEQVGRVVDALDNGPSAANTIIILWSDHGWHLGEKKHWRKFALWEEATKAPLMMVVPGVTKPGEACQVPVDFMNIYPTLADLCGLPVGRHLDGVSMRPLLADVNATWDRPAMTTHGRGNNAVRTRRWRYIRYVDGSEELYDHNADPGEWSNLALQRKHRKLKAELASFMPDEEDNAPDAPIDPKVRSSKKRKRKKKKKR